MKSVFGLEENLASALAYVFGFVSGLIVLILEKENKTVRFHAIQSILWFLLIAIIRWVLSAFAGLPLLGWILGILLTPIFWVLGIVTFVSWVVLIYKAVQGEAFKIPIIGDVVWNYVNK